MPDKKLQEYLDQNGVQYRVLPHEPAYTSQEIAARASVSGWKMVKTIIIKVDGRYAMAVLPANERVTPERLQRVIGAGSVSFADGNELAALFPGIVPGAMPPFGNLYGMDVYMEQMPGESDIAFNAGNFSELIILSFADFRRLARPRILDEVAAPKGV